MYWNIRAGGGKRVDAIADQIQRWRPDVVGLCEFRGTPPGIQLAGHLADLGLIHQLNATDPQAPAVNSVFLASHRPLRRVRLRNEPADQRRWRLARIGGGPWVGVFHAPNYVTGRKRPFFDAILRSTAGWRGGPAIIGGDSNTGIPPLDGNPNAFHDWEAEWIGELARRRWHDAYRHFHPTRPSYTWYSPNAGNGYRLDQAFLNRRALPGLRRARYQWGQPRPATTRRDQLSDHAALILDLNL